MLLWLGADKGRAVCVWISTRIDSVIRNYGRRANESVQTTLLGESNKRVDSWVEWIQNLDKWPLFHLVFFMLPLFDCVYGRLCNTFQCTGLQINLNMKIIYKIILLRHTNQHKSFLRSDQQVILNKLKFNTWTGYECKDRSNFKEIWMPNLIHKLSLHFKEFESLKWFILDIPSL